MYHGQLAPMGVTINSYFHSTGNWEIRRSPTWHGMHHVFNSALFLLLSLICTFPYIIRMSTWIDNPTAKRSCRQKGTIFFFLFMRRDFDSPSYIMRVRTHRPQCLLILSLNPIKAFACGHFHHPAPRWSSSRSSWSSSPSALSPSALSPRPSPPTPVRWPRTLVRKLSF